MNGLLTAVRAGRSETLVIRGEAGIGKSALLEFLVDRASGCRVARVTGVESEMELAYAGLHQLCAPLLDRMSRLPTPQQEALGTALGLRAGSAPDRFLVGLAVLTLLSEVADGTPFICCVDDAQWLDHASALVLEFVARRLAAESVVLVFAVRDSAGEAGFDGLPELVVHGLIPAESAVLLQSAVAGAIEVGVRDRIVAESHGNPLALLELPGGLSAGDLSFERDDGLDVTPIGRRLEQRFLRRMQPLPDETRQMLLTAAAEPVGDIRLLWRAAERLGISTDAVNAAETAGLIELDGAARFRHPLVRSAVYRAATPAERRHAHQVLASVMDSDADPDRRAWHLARAALGPDEDVAAELERSAGRALAQGGLAAGAAFLERAAFLTADPRRRVRRSLDAAHAKMQIGKFDDAETLLEMAEAGPLTEADRARIDLVRAGSSFAANHGNVALPLLLAAARRLEPLDPALARDTYLDALSAALFAGRLAIGSGAREVAIAARTAPPSDTPRKRDALLEGLAIRFTEGYEPAVPASRRAVRAFASEELALDEALGFTWLAAATAASLWDDVHWDILTRRHLEIARDAGALSALPLALATRTVVLLFTGDLAAAAVLVEETRFIAEVTRSSLSPYGEMGLLALRGLRDEAEPMIEDCLEDVRARGEGVGINMAGWARAVLWNGLGRYEEAFRAAVEATQDPLELGPPQWALGELVEAAARSGELTAAEAGLNELSAMARVSGSDWALGIEASRRALLRDGDAAEELYREGIVRLARTRMRVELARAQLLYGEWLRRQGRRSDARAQLRTSYEALDGMGLEAFAERARRELVATGETVRKRKSIVATEFTLQEANIARLAAQGFTNAEIGTQLYISHRTVEWHLHHIFAKLGVNTRRDLRRSLPNAYRVAT